VDDRLAAGMGDAAAVVCRLIYLADRFSRASETKASASTDGPTPARGPSPVEASPSDRDDLPDAETWFRELHPRLYAYIRYRVADLQEAEDLTSEIIERALTHLDSYDARKGALSTWLFRIAHNQFVNYVKRRQRSSQHQVDLGEGLEDLATDEPSPEQVAVRKEEAAQLLACVRTLSPRQQEILSMRFAGRLSNREIAKVLEMNERTVSVTILRALRTLRRKLALSI
jgi:RNA polymerase sigma-70 factor (ECF subfamily)